MQVNACYTNEDWAVTLDEFDHGVFLVPEWAEAFHADGHKPLYLDFVNEGHVVAKMAGFSIGDRFAYKRKLVFHAGPAIRPGETGLLPECLSALATFAGRNGYGRVRIFSYDFRHTFLESPRYHVYPRTEFLIDLIPELETITGRMNRQVNRNYKKALKEDISFTETWPEDPAGTMDILLGETLKVRTGKGYHAYNPFYLPYFNKEVFLELLKKNCLRIVTVRKGEAIQGMYIMLVDGIRAYGLLIGISEQGYSYGLSAYIHYVTIHRLKKEGYTYLNLGGISPDQTHKGLLEFKQSLGAAPVNNSFAETDFLVFPWSLLNPLMRLKRTRQEKKDRQEHGVHDSSEPR